MSAGDGSGGGDGSGTVPVEPDDDDGEGESSGGPPEDDDSDDGGSTTGEPEGTDDSGDDGSSGGEEPFTPSLNQAAYNGATGEYEFGHDSIPTIPITGAPDDVDWGRWAMLHDGAAYRFYALPVDEADRVYQFAFNAETVAYEYGFDSIPTIPVTGAPEDADPSRISMLHDGATYRLYMLSEAAPLRVHQFGYDPVEGEYVYGHNSIPEIQITGTPAGADWGGWGMLHDGADYRLYAFASGAADSMVQHAYDGAVGQYVYAFRSIPQLDLTGIPADSDTTDFAMLHDGAAYRFYFLTQPEG